MKPGTRFYLSGGMEYAGGEGRDWRLMMEEWLGSALVATAFNPNTESDIFFRTRHPGVDFRALKTSNIEQYRAIAAELVATDTTEIARHTDILICYWDDGAARGAGTKGELTMARFFGKPVYMVTAIPHADIPGWVLGCTDRFFTSFDELKAFLHQQ